MSPAHTEPLSRCPWANRSELEQHYHDQEWGIPLHDDQRLFEFLILEGAQAGLSWVTILRKREAYRAAFDQFDPIRVSEYGEADMADLLANPALVRNRLKMKSAVQNARAFRQIQEIWGSFDAYLWQFVDFQPRINVWPDQADMPASTPESDRLSKDLKSRGFSFVGSIICYSFMQAVGMVSDHTADCFRNQVLQDKLDTNQQQQAGQNRA